MSKLIPITIVCLILAIASHLNSDFDAITWRYRSKDRLFYGIMGIFMVLFVGLRTSYNDTATYTAIYELMSPNESIPGLKEWLEIGGNPGFQTVNIILKRLGASSQTYLMVYAIPTVTIYLWFIRKYSCTTWLSIFLFISFAGFTFLLAAIKQCFAMALCMIATDRALNKKYGSFVFYILVACTFHPYALMYLIVPFMTFCPWSGSTVVVLLIFAALGMCLQALMGTIVNVTDMLGEEYTKESFTQDGVNPLRLAAVSVPIFISMLERKQIASCEDKTQYLILNMTMLNAEIMFVGLFGTANYFARLANYFLPFQALSIPWLLTHFNQMSRRLVIFIAIICYGMFFYYSNAINQIFDFGYDSVTLLEYLDSLF